ncbi:MAG: sigma 54-interacting transcriptional regulator [Pseudomonadota bacterium]
MRNDIFSSWVRSSSAGIDPQRGEAPAAEGADHVAQLRRANRELCDAASGSIYRIGHMLNGTDAMLVLTERHGTVMEAIGDRATLEAAREINLHIGGQWREEAVGTNGIGTALWSGRPMFVHGSEHFVETLKCWSCAAAPIRDPIDRSVIGAVDLSGFTSIFREHNIAFAAAAAGEIEAALAQGLSEERIRLLEALIEKIPARGEDDGLLLLDRHGRIMHRCGVDGLVARDGTVIDTRLGQRLIDLGGAVSLEAVTAALPSTLEYRDVTTIDLDGELRGVALILEQHRRQPSVPRAVQSIRPRAKPRRVTGGEIVAECPAMLRAIDLTERVARVNAPVLIQGETGTGKELFARLIHAEHSAGRDTPYVAVNCGAISREVFGGELFGHVDGAFTGALRQGKAGKLEEAKNGVFCLDEIGEMPLELQPYLLRVLEERVIHRIGETHGRPFEARLVALTNRDLAAEAEAGRFRSDLYYRIDAVTVEVPPLRERGDDILLLLDHFNLRTAQDYGQQPLAFAPELEGLFLGYRWPGNVRELRNLVQRLHSVCGGRTATAEDLPPGMIAEAPADEPSAKDRLQDAEKTIIIKAFERHNGNLSRVAEDLGITRPTLYRRLRQHNIQRVYR